MFLVFSDFELDDSLRSLLLITVGIYLLAGQEIDQANALTLAIFGFPSNYGMVAEDENWKDGYC